MEMDAKTALVRFCHLGSIEPVYVHLKGPIDVTKFWPKISKLCQDLDDIQFLKIMNDVLHQRTLVRRDEAIFVYAAYLTTDTNIKWKINVRKLFPLSIRDDNDLFLFCKYCVSIQKFQKREGFTNTMRKAITAWYKSQPSSAIQDMWMMHRGAHGFTHKSLLKLCHVNDETLGTPNGASPFFKTCSELMMSEINESTATVSERNKKAKKLAKAKALKHSVVVDAPVISMSRLRTTKNKCEALKIIEKFKLQYEHVPKYLMRYSAVMQALIPSMSYMQLLKCWRSMSRFNILHSSKVFKLCQSILEDKNNLRLDNIHPIVLLLRLDELGVRKDNTKLPVLKVEAMRLTYLREIYEQSFGHNQPTGLRMHITINLQTNYLKKRLNNCKALSYIDAAVALAFGYYKLESNADVFCWGSESQLKPLPWTKAMTVNEAKECCEKIVNPKNKQNLTIPLVSALKETKIYDVFLVIVPSAGRGNPGQKSEHLCKTLDMYRQSKNDKTKFVIVNLRKFKRSMTYSTLRNENIMEICGLDKHTTDLINNFALNCFG